VGLLVLNKSILMDFLLFADLDFHLFLLNRLFLLTFRFLDQLFGQRI